MQPEFPQSTHSKLEEVMKGDTNYWKAEKATTCELSSRRARSVSRTEVVISPCSTPTIDYDVPVISYGRQMCT